MIKLIILLILTFSMCDSVEWINWTSGDNTYPVGAVEGGHFDGMIYFVIRANYYGGLLPGKYSASESFAAIANGGNEIYVRDMQVRQF